MISLKVTRENLSQSVKIALSECTKLLDSEQKAGNNAATRDLQTAIFALRLIESELQAGSGRLKNQRSAAFTRYVVDEEKNIVISDELKNLIVKIEGAYKRY